jgi:hypothetical protein
MRLDPNYVIPSNLSPETKAVESAAQKYGIVVKDKAGAVAFNAINTNSFPGQPNPYKFNWNEIRRFPLSHLQVVAPNWGKPGTETDYRNVKVNFTPITTTTVKP